MLFLSDEKNLRRNGQLALIKILSYLHGGVFSGDELAVDAAYFMHVVHDFPAVAAF